MHAFLFDLEIMADNTQSYTIRTLINDGFFNCQRYKNKRAKSLR